MKKYIIAFAALVISLCAFAGMSNSLDYSRLNIVGSAVPGGWDTKATPMTKISYGVFSWTGLIKAGEDFKFMNSDDWHKHLVATTPNEILGLNEMHPLNFEVHYTLPVEKDLKFRVAKTGRYRLLVDLVSLQVKLTEEPDMDLYPDKYYATGSALDNKIIEINNINNFECKAVFDCKPGNLILMDTPEKTAGTTYYVPMFEDVDITFGSGFSPVLQQTDNPDALGWSVSAPGVYTMYISCSNHRHSARKFTPRSVLYLAGGCCELAWDYRDESNCRFKPNPENEEELIWEGELKIRDSNTPEPNKFKILTGQDWSSENYHPYVSDELAEGTCQIRTTDGDDSKWIINKDGNYKITANTKYETITFEYLGEVENKPVDKISTAGIDGAEVKRVEVATRANAIELVYSPETVNVAVFNAAGSQVAGKNDMHKGVIVTGLSHGIYIVSLSGETVKETVKVVI